MSQDKKKYTKGFGTVIGSTRFIMGIAVLTIFVGSSVLLIVGSIEMFSDIWHALTVVESGVNEELKVVMVEAVDTILISTVLYVIAIGLYQLFIDKNLVVPKWLHTEDVVDLEIRLAGMIITILGVGFMTRSTELESGKDLMFLGFAIASVIAAISFFLYQERK